ncbi:MAG: hypothetical protein HY291_15230 [Planctomycetes bacterium]|nr:hypothetical protein [Planctomycetota bacterium]
MLKIVSNRWLATGFGVVLLGLAGLSGRAFAAADDTNLKDVTIVVADEPYTGELIRPPTDTEFRFKLKETGDTLTFRWSSLAETERKRVQKLFGIEVQDGQVTWGDKVNCVRLKLKSGKAVEGMELPDRAIPGLRVLKTYSQTLYINNGDIDAEDKIEKRESDIYSAKEFYERKLLERPPPNDSASAHQEFAQMCSNIGLYDKAIDHLEMAKTIDPRVEERTTDFRAELVRKHAEKQAEKVYLQILTDLQAGDNASALQKIDTFMRNFPSSEYRTRVESMKPEVEKAGQIDFTKQIIFMYYHLANELIADRLNKKVRVDDKGRPVPSVPGKQVTTRQSNIFRGELVSEGADKVVLKQGDTTLEIRAKDILSIQDVDLSKSFRAIEPSFAELKAYVTDANAGLGKDIVSRISQLLKIDEQKIKDTWAGRFNRTATYEEGNLVHTPVYANLHSAFYSSGSWLRDGAQFAPNGNGGAGGRNNGGRNGGGRNGGSGGNSGSSGSGGTGGSGLGGFTSGGNNGGRNGGNNGGRNGNANGNNAQEEQDKLFPQNSDDPEIWWRVQSGETRLSILRAFASEKLFRVKEPVSGKVCPECGGKGGIEVTGNDSQLTMVRCPLCRGLRLLTVINYE